MKLYDFVRPDTPEEATEAFDKALKNAKVEQDKLIEKAKEKNDGSSQVARKRA